MQLRLLTDSEALNVGHQLFLLSEEMEKRLKYLYENEQDTPENRAKSVWRATRKFIMTEAATGRMLVRDIDHRFERVDCPCHRDITVNESELIHEHLGLFHDRICHLFRNTNKDTDMAYLSHLARELVRVSVETGLMYLGKPLNERDAGPAEASPRAAAAANN